MIKSLLRVLMLSLLMGTPFAAMASVNLKTSHPDTYYVKQGDTLWDIAGKFLQEPWQWPEIWQINQDIPNPHLIYPGDVLHLTYVNGEPRITVERGEQGKAANNGYPTVKLSPSAEAQPLNSAIPTVPLAAIQSFLKKGQVVTEKQLKTAPYLLGGQDGRTTYAEGDIVYVRDPINHWKNSARSFGIYRTGVRYIDPETREVLGYEALLVGHLKMIRKKDGVATMKVINSKRGLHKGDIILPTVRHKRLARYFPETPDQDVHAQIIRLFGAVYSVGRNSVVVINKGKREGLEEGDLLAIRRDGEVVKDPKLEQFVELPDRRIGSLLLFHVYDKVSYGLIMKSVIPVRMNDKVITPK